MNHKAVYRTAAATPGLLIMWIDVCNVVEIIQKVASTPTFGLCLITLKLYFVHPQPLTRFDFFFMRKANIFYLVVQRKEGHIWSYHVQKILNF